MRIEAGRPTAESAIGSDGQGVGWRLATGELDEAVIDRDLRSLLSGASSLRVETRLRRLAKQHLVREAIQELARGQKDTNAILHVTC